MRYYRDCAHGIQQLLRCVCSALHIVAEASQRYVCGYTQPDARDNMLVVPYASPHVSLLPMLHLQCFPGFTPPVGGPQSFLTESLRGDGAPGGGCQFPACVCPTSHKLLSQLEEEPQPRPKHTRDIHTYFHGGCARNGSEGSYGYRMRAFAIKGIQELKLRGVSVTCTSDRPVIPLSVAWLCSLPCSAHC